MTIAVLGPQPVPADAVELGIPVRDGVVLAADGYGTDGGPRPVVLVRLPYDKDGVYCFMPDVARWFTARGYAVVVQDVRGKFRSGGATEFGIHEVADGYDTIAWIAGQEWCDGDVVMWGDSYFGMTQLAAATSGAPALRAISPRLTGTQLAQDIVHRHGGPDVEATSRKGYFSSWYVDGASYEWAVDWSARPLRRQFEEFFDALGRRSVNFDAEFDRSAGRPRFAGPDLDQLVAAPALPVLFTVGLFDNCAHLSWHDLDRLLVADGWRDSVHLRLEAIDHELNRYGERLRPETEVPDLDEVLRPTVEFFDAVLADRLADVPRVSFEVVHGEPGTLPSWPPATAVEEVLHLASGADVPGLVVGSGAEQTATWDHDPQHPVPATADNPFARLAGRDPAVLVAPRADVLQFTGDAVAEDREYLGPVHVVVPLGSTAGRTNLHVRLLDLDPAGHGELVTKGQVHVRDTGGSAPTTVDLLTIAWRLRRGHRWALQLMSSDWPEYVLEPGDGSDPWEAEVFASSTQTVRLGGTAGAHVVLTVR